MQVSLGSPNLDVILMIGKLGKYLISPRKGAEVGLEKYIVDHYLNQVVKNITISIQITFLGIEIFEDGDLSSTLYRKPSTSNTIYYMHQALTLNH